MAAAKDKVTNRRDHFRNQVSHETHLSDQPVELPAGARTPGAKSISQQIQEQIAIQIAKKNQGQ